MSVFVRQNTAGSQSLELFVETLNRVHEAPPVQKIGDNEVSLHRQPCEMKGWEEEGHPRWSCAPGTRTIRMCSFDGRTLTNIGALPREKKEASLKGSIRKLTVARCAQ